MNLGGEDGAARWGGEDGAANLGGEVGRRGWAARTERRTLVAKLGGEDGEARGKRRGGMVAKSLRANTRERGRKCRCARARGGNLCARARAHLQMWALLD